MLIALCTACSANDETHVAPAPGGRTACSAGEWQHEDGRCIPAGLPPDMPCPPGEWLRNDGLCIPAGVPPDGCGEGFVHDGDRGCEPILPAEPCPFGLMAVPGETECREVAPCGTHKWGEIPIEADTEFVDGSYAGGDSDGSVERPWTTIQNGQDAALNGAIVAVAAGRYEESVIITTPGLRLHGRCPELVEVVGLASHYSAIDIFANDVQVHGLAVSGAAAGVAVLGAAGARLNQIWVHDNAFAGVDVQDAATAASVELRRSNVEHNGEFGVFFLGVHALVDQSVIRHTRVTSQDTLGRGVTLQTHEFTLKSSVVRISRSVLEDNGGAGAATLDSTLEVAETVIRNNGARVDTFGDLSSGIVGDSMLGETALVVSGSVVQRNHGSGIHAQGTTQTTLHATVVRDTRTDATGYGRGVNVLSQSHTNLMRSLEAYVSLVERNANTGVFVGGSDAYMYGVAVRASTQGIESARGVAVQANPMTGVPSTLECRSCSIEDNGSSGILVAGSSAVLVDSAVAGSEQSVIAQESARDGTPSTLEMNATSVERSVVGGVVIRQSNADITSCLVRDTLGTNDGLFGDGIVVVSWLPGVSTRVSSSRVDESARVALSLFGGAVDYTGNTFTCQAFDLVGETLEGNPYAVRAGGGNECGCPDATGDCILETPGLVAPPPIADGP